MVITDLPFQRADHMSARYCALFGQEEQTMPVQEMEEDRQAKSQEYAAFLKEKERKCGPDGFLDSRKYQHTFALKHDKEDEEERRPNRPQSMTVVDLRLRKNHTEKESEKKLKVIEDHMWQHKQEERELKRIEGDIIKNQRAVRRTIREFENTMARKRIQETKKLNQGLEKYTREQNAHIHEKEELTKQRLEANINSLQNHKDMGRKVQLTTSDLARQYKAKASEMELKKIELTRLSQEYESKLRAKEEEQFRVKQELADLAISLNSEAQKGRQMEADYQRGWKKQTVQRITETRNAECSLSNKLGKSDGDTKIAETNRRKLSADLTLTRGHLQLKQREEGRHLQDTGNRLRTNITEQKALNEAAMHADLDIKARHINQKMTEHESRRRAAATVAIRQKKDKVEAHESHYSEKFQRRHTDQNRREHEDHLKFFQKMVQKGEEREHSLYNRVRNADYARQKQEQNVRRLQSKLHDLKKQNAQKLKVEMTELNKAEQEIEQKLIREQAELAKVHASREETYINLHKHRHGMREDKYSLQEHEREHSRLLQVGRVTDGRLV